MTKKRKIRTIRALKNAAHFRDLTRFSLHLSGKANIVAT
ncbi:hypothetical protein IMCC3088_2593 [Aequoribacter fuscus]|uniref:Uncharacterized protein n=1 Tax=Aequoribacter fuscus TaxID=2518989 RepID=F3L4J2_9GAMM|nr:hypothetical protein IMCC3088_2593 [Aequoribacter fuscus]